jgi:hypothetical protein
MICKECGKTFEPSFSNATKGYGLFCGKDCYFSYRKKAILSGEYKTKKKVYTFVCIHCNKEFTRTGHDKHNNKYCSRDCSQQHRVGKLHPRFNQVPVECTQCHTELSRSPSYIKGESWGNFCNHDCKAKWMSEHNAGANHPQWQGGISYEPYCPLFNETFKQRVRAFFNNTCVSCGKLEADSNEHLHVHHVVYNKLTCCDDSPKLFVALCRSCHTKTNHNRELYEEQFRNLIATKYQGRSYFTVEEWELLNPTTS